MEQANFFSWAKQHFSKSRNLAGWSLLGVTLIVLETSRRSTKYNYYVDTKEFRMDDVTDNTASLAQDDRQQYWNLPKSKWENRNMEVNNIYAFPMSQQDAKILETQQRIKKIQNLPTTASDTAKPEAK